MKAEDVWIFSGVTSNTGMIFPYLPFCIGPFELARSPVPYPEAQTALDESGSAFSERFDPQNNYLISGLMVRAESRSDLIRSARLLAQEALTLFSRTTPFHSRMELLSSGFTVHLATGRVQPILPPPAAFEQKLQMVGLIDTVAHHPSGIINLLLTSPPDAFGDLAKALRRSTHWSSLAHGLDEDSGRLLLQWMACETLTRVLPEETLTSKLVSALGFPSVKYAQQLGLAHISELRDCQGYQRWRPQLNVIFDRIRNARNSIVHGGFRELDLPEFFTTKERKLVDLVLRMTVPRLQDLALSALVLGIKSVDEMWSRYGECALRGRQVSLSEEIEGTLVYALDRLEVD